jgi:flagellar hook assembly protein FlgD
MDATGLAEDDYSADIILATNDPANPTLTIPVSMTVTTWVGVDGDVPLNTIFFGAVPNPFSPATSLHFSLPRETHVDLRIYDVAGRLVRTLVSGSRPAGSNEVRWNGKDNGGQDIASGTYFARLIVDEEVEIKSLTLMR